MRGSQPPPTRLRLSPSCAGYKRSAAIKQRLAAVCRAHLTLGFLALAWAVAVPLMRGKTVLPLPCTTSLTAIFSAISGSGVASGRITQHSLEQYVKLSKAALFLVRVARRTGCGFCTLTLGAQGVLAFFLPRYKLVPGGPVRSCAAARAARDAELRPPCSRPRRLGSGLRSSSACHRPPS